MSLPTIGGTNTGGPSLVDVGSLPGSGFFGGIFQDVGNQINQDITAQYQANLGNQNLANQYNYLTVQDDQVFFNPNTSNLQFINALGAAGLIPSEDQNFLKAFFKDSTNNWLVRRFNDASQGYDFTRDNFAGLNDENFAIMMRLQNTLNPFVDAASLPASGVFLGTSFEGTGGGSSGDPYSPDNPPPPNVTYSGRPVFIGQAPSGRTGGEGVFYTKEDVLLRTDEVPDLYSSEERKMPVPPPEDDPAFMLPPDNTTNMANGGIVSLAMNGMDRPTGQGIETFLNRDRSKAALQRNLQRVAQQRQQQQQQMMAQQGPPGMMPPGMPPQGMPPQGMPPQGMMPPGPPPMAQGPVPTMQQGIMPMAG